MRKLLFIVLNFYLAFSMAYSQDKSSTAINHAENDTTLTPGQADTTLLSFTLQRRALLKPPTLQPMRIGEDQKKFSITIRQNPLERPEEATNWDALNMPTKRTDYELSPDYLKYLVPITPYVVPPKEPPPPLLPRDYLLPTRQELDILEILWTKEDVMDTTIYSCLDITLLITMEDLNRLLEKMTRKGLVARKQVSPRHEFNAFGVLIEMSPQNRRNRIFAYHSNVDRELMRKFINANAYLYENDSTIVNLNQLQAVKNDSTLLQDLNAKIYQPKP